MKRAAAIFVLVVSINAFGQAPDAKPFAGCYELTMSEWRPKLRDKAKSTQPPAKIELTSVTRPDDDGYAVLPAAGAAPSAHLSSRWKVLSPKKIQISSSDGFCGVELTLEPADGRVLKGKAQTFWDYTDRRETSFVTAKPISCETPLMMDAQSR